MSKSWRPKYSPPNAHTSNVLYGTRIHKLSLQNRIHKLSLQKARVQMWSALQGLGSLPQALNSYIVAWRQLRKIKKQMCMTICIPIHFVYEHSNPVLYNFHMSQYIFLTTFQQFRDVIPFFTSLWHWSSAGTPHIPPLVLCMRWFLRTIINLSPWMQKPSRIIYEHILVG